MSMGKTKLGVGVKTKYCLHLCLISNDDSDREMSEGSVKTFFYLFLFIYLLFNSTLSSCVVISYALLLIPPFFVFSLCARTRSVTGPVLESLSYAALSVWNTRSVTGPVLESLSYAALSVWNTRLQS